VQKEVLLQHGRERRNHERKMLRKATGHDGIDGQLLCRDRPFSDGFDTYEMLWR
jgi:hypothetical protein